MRLLAASLIAASFLLALGVGGAASRPAEKRYVQVEVHTLFEYRVDRGRDGGIMGTYAKAGFYSLHTIAVFDGNRLRSPGITVVGGGVAIMENRTKNVLVNGMWQEVPYCEGWDSQIPENTYVKSAVSRGAGVSIGNTARLDVKAGAVMSVKIPRRVCNESENLHTHGLTPGPSFSMPAPAKSRFRGRTSFSLTCVEKASHGPEKHGVESFSGKVVLIVKITPFPAGQLEARQEKLRDEIGYSTRILDGKNSSDVRGKACL